VGRPSRPIPNEEKANPERAKLWAEGLEPKHAHPNIVDMFSKQAGDRRTIGEPRMAWSKTATSNSILACDQVKNKAPGCAKLCIGTDKPK
jgi:hypothetical protein